MKKILILMGRYLPGHKDGGPLRTIINLTDTLGDEYDFRIVTLDRDHGDAQTYCNIKTNQWNQVGKANVWYVRPGGFSFKLLKRMAAQADLVYCCGFYNDYGYKTLILNRLGMLNKRPVVVASMGTFSPGALAQKALKKKLFIQAFKIMGLFKKITWSVTSNLEELDLKRVVGEKAICVIAEDLPRNRIVGEKRKQISHDNLRIVFLSRISPMKNLIGAARALQGVKAKVEFTICGPKSDKEYWKQCKKELNKLPENVIWTYEGDVPSEKVPEKFLAYDVFIFPSMGENYGHVIFEALSAGCIPIISDRTPWQSVQESGAGLVLPLDEDMHIYAQEIDRIAEMSEQERHEMSEKAVLLAKEKAEKAALHTGYRVIFGK